MEYLKIIQRFDGGDRNFTENLFGNPVVLTMVNKAVELVQRRRHQFHAYPAIPFPEKGAVKLDDVRAVAAAHDLAIINGCEERNIEARQKRGVITGSATALSDDKQMLKSAGRTFCWNPWEKCFSIFL